MIPYEDLVAALSAWRARNGLPVGDANYLGEPASSQLSYDLPVTEPEVMELEDSGAIEEIDEPDAFVEELAAEEDPALAAQTSEHDLGDDADAASVDYSEVYGDLDTPADALAEGSYDGLPAVDAPDAEAGDVAAQGEEALEVGDDVAIEEEYPDESGEVDVAGDFAGLADEATVIGEHARVEQLPEESTRVGGAPDFAGLDAESTAIGVGAEHQEPGEVGEVDISTDDLVPGDDDPDRG